ncbi:MAG: hypothetical protein V4787_27280 [Pseudomonadota bacterium]
MSKQLSVQGQNDRTRARIAQLAAWFAQPRRPVAWLPELLENRGLSSSEGILVEFSEIPEQNGSFCKGIWLSDSRRFWHFEIVVPRGGPSAVSVEVFRDVTSEISVDAHIPGIGKSFGFLAIEVLEGGVDI